MTEEKRHRITAVVAAIAALAAMALAAPESDALPQCMFEDGSDVDGPCLWVDPDTGKVYLNK